MIPDLTAPRVEVPARVRRSLQEVAVATVVGIGTGVLVAGVGSRLAMRAIAATSDPRLRGVLTSDREPIGEITLGGSIGLIVFVGVLGGAVLGLAYVVLRPLLADDLRWRAVSSALLVWCVGAASMFDASDFDFRRLEPGWLSVVMFSAIFLAAGWVVAAGVEVALRSWPPPGRATWWRYAPLVLLLPFFPLLAVLLIVALARSATWPRLPFAVRTAARAALVAGAALLAVPAVGEIIEIV